MALNDTVDQIDLIDIFIVFHTKAAEYMLFLSTYGKFSRIGYMLDHKTNLNKFKNIEIISNILPSHNGMKLEINYKIKQKI